MKTYSHIITAIDFTPSSRAALRESVRLAPALGARITAVHIMDEFLVHELKKALSEDDFDVIAEWRERLRKFVDESDLGTAHVDVEVTAGHPFNGLVAACERHHAELLVMGTKGSREQPGRVGVIAAKCVRKAPVDVLLVREDAHGANKRIVTCTDFSEHSSRAMSRAFEIARIDGAALDCVHVYQSALALTMDAGGLGAPIPYMPDPHEADNWRETLARAVEPFQREAPSLTITPVLIERLNIREAIIGHVTETGASLVVLNTRGKTGLREMLIGTTAENIVSHAPCSILAVKPEILPTDKD